MTSHFGDFSPSAVYHSVLLTSADGISWAPGIMLPELADGPQESPPRQTPSTSWAKRPDASRESQHSATPATGLDTTSYIQCELIKSINTDRLVHRLGTIDPETSNQVATVIKTLLNY